MIHSFSRWLKHASEASGRNTGLYYTGPARACGWQYAAVANKLGWRKRRLSLGLSAAA